MASGPYHYSEAEHDLAKAFHHSTDPEGRTFLVARAQVHATLALAAAQIEDMDSDVLRPGWAEIVDGQEEA